MYQEVWPLGLRTVGKKWFELRDLQKLYEACVHECKDANIPIRDNRVYKIKFTEHDSESSWGFCVLNKKRMTFSIFINSTLSSEACPIEELKDTVIHELLHTCPRCQGHGKTWMKYAGILNEKYGYELTTTRDDDAVFHKGKPVLHRYICKTCGSVFNLRTENETYFNPNARFICVFCRSPYPKTPAWSLPSEEINQRNS